MVAMVAVLVEVTRQVVCGTQVGRTVAGGQGRRQRRGAAGLGGDDLGVAVRAHRADTMAAQQRGGAHLLA
jgi:hypothetical protein